MRGKFLHLLLIAQNIVFFFADIFLLAFYRFWGCIGLFTPSPFFCTVPLRKTLHLIFATRRDQVDQSVLRASDPSDASHVSRSGFTWDDRAAGTGLNWHLGFTVVISTPRTPGLKRYEIRPLVPPLENTPCLDFWVGCRSHGRSNPSSRQGWVARFGFSKCNFLSLRSQKQSVHNYNGFVALSRQT